MPRAVLESDRPTPGRALGRWNRPQDDGFENLRRELITTLCSTFLHGHDADREAAAANRARRPGHRRMAPVMQLGLPRHQRSLARRNAMRWQSVLSVTSVVVSLATFTGSAHAAGAVSAPATAEPRFIRDAQRTLGELGYRPGPIDGVVGRRTQSALARYQRSEGIPVTGYLDAETLVRLDIHRRVSPAGDRREGARAGRPPARPAG